MPITTVTTSYGQITTGDATAISIQNRGSVPILVAGTATAVAPSNDDNAILLQPGDAILSDITLAEIWPAVASVARVYARAVRDTAAIWSNQ